ncbi:MAG: cytochrome c biogenesis protein CcsA [Rikenellaceae bacterium]
MKDRAIKFITSRLLALVLLIIYGVALAAATFVEKFHGIVMAKELIYNSVPMILMQALMVINFIAIFIKSQYLKAKRWGVALTHSALIIILLGALTTHLTGREGVLHIRVGESSNRMVVQTPERQELVSLPFEVELLDFVLKRYSGSMSPSSFESFIVVHADGESKREHIYMNNTLDVKGYRLFQASYDPDEKGTVLIVNQDVMGRVITYTGYTLLGLGFLLSLLLRNSRPNSLLRRLSDIKKSTLVVSILTLSLFASSGLYAQADTRYLSIAEEHSVPSEYADKFGAIPMQDSRGRIVPVNTFASELVRKLYKEHKVGELTANQFLMSLWIMPDIWMQIPFIEYSNPDLQSEYRFKDGEYISYIELFDIDGNYILEETLEEIYSKSANERSKFEKGVLELDENANILSQALNMELVTIFPKEGDKGNKWYAPGGDLSSFEGGDSMFVSRIFPLYINSLGEALTGRSEWSQSDEYLDMITLYQQKKGYETEYNPSKIEAEVKYNRLNIFSTNRVFYLIMGLFLLILSFGELFTQRRWIGYTKIALGAVVVANLCYHIYGIALRWYISGYAPWSNSYETMVYISLIVALVGLIFARRTTFVFAVSTLLAGVVLFVAGLSWMEPEITPLVPVLKSPWLMIHVAVIVASYGLFGISFLLGVTNLILMIIKGRAENKSIERGIEELTLINEISLWYGFALMSAGTFLGAIWANESWGRYWGWDPKETWALITMVVYAIVTHLYIVPGAYNKLRFNFLSVVAFLSVLMTYFGVNFFLGGQHAYNSTSLSSSTLLYIAVSVILIFVLGAVAAVRYKQNKQKQ